MTAKNDHPGGDTLSPSPNLNRAPFATPPPAPPRRGALFVWFVVFALLAVGLFVWLRLKNTPAAGPGGAPGVAGGRPAMGSFPVPVVPGTVQKKDVSIFLDGLGTVQAFNTVTIRSRVDGQVQRIAFVEGQEVHVGDLLAQIDPAPFQAQLDQNVAKKAEDQAQLTVAKITLTRDADLLASKVLAQQDYDTQKALVDQLAASVKADEAAIESAKVQLAYTQITSPLEGRVGIRLVDQGNIVHANDTTGIVVLTQLRPISVLFTLPEQNLRRLQSHLGGNEPLRAFAVDRDNRTPLGEGTLAVIDNQIDTTTGTIRIKATFPNEDLRLWPGQFVNVRLLLSTRKDGIVVPASVVQRGPEGAFAYVIADDLTAKVRPIKVAQIEQNEALIDDGLAPGEQVVVDGQYKLQPNAKVKLPDASAEAPKAGGRGPAKAPASPAK